MKGVRLMAAPGAGTARGAVGFARLSSPMGALNYYDGMAVEIHLQRLASVVPLTRLHRTPILVDDRVRLRTNVASASREPFLGESPVDHRLNGEASRE